MAMNPIPPQAYTKDTLQKAFSWLQTQDPSIRAMAATADVLVSLYLKATRDGDGVLQRPSIQNFKNELRHLAPMMDEFEKSGQKLPFQSDSLEGQNGVNQSNSSGWDPTLELGAESSTRPIMSKSPSQDPFHAYAAPPPLIDNRNSVKSQPFHSGQGHSQKFGNEFEDSQELKKLDLRSQVWVGEIKEKFNLSNDQEALRLLIRFGYVKLMNSLKE